MAIIKCPECGQDISDKAKKCIHCGHIFVEQKQEELRCAECGEIISDTDTVCHNCGCPIEKISEVSQQPVGVKEVKVNTGKRKIILGAVIALFVCAFVGVGTVIFLNWNGKQRTNTYIDNLKKAQSLMLDGGSEAESLCNLTKKVWYQCIYTEDADYTTKNYVIRPEYRSYSNFSSYMYVDDFNTGLSNLYSDSDTEQKIESIENNQEAVEVVIKKLQNCPEDLEECYNSLNDLYDCYLRITNMAINPSGSYNSFTSEFNSVDNDFMTNYNKLKSKLPDKR